MAQGWRRGDRSEVYREGNREYGIQLPREAALMSGVRRHTGLHRRPAAGAALCKTPPVRYTCVMPRYFAYGTNMDRALMRLRCPGAHALGTAALAGWRLVVTVDGYVSIVPRPGACVHGVLWRLTPRDLAALNAYEAVAAGLYRQRLLSVSACGKRQLAHTYVGRSATPGAARPGHLSMVIAAARDWSLPPAYIAQLRRWSGSGWHGARAPESGEVGGAMP
jgi:Gamma-glutamyl cyclotransferase, AIG2-like